MEPPTVDVDRATNSDVVHGVISGPPLHGGNIPLTLQLGTFTRVVQYTVVGQEKLNDWSSVGFEPFSSFLRKPFFVVVRVRRDGSVSKCIERATQLSKHILPVAWLCRSKINSWAVSRLYVFQDRAVFDMIIFWLLYPFTCGTRFSDFSLKTLPPTTFPLSCHLWVRYTMPPGQSALQHPAVFLPILIDLHG